MHAKLRRGQTGLHQFIDHISHSNASPEPKSGRRHCDYGKHLVDILSPVCFPANKFCIKKEIKKRRLTVTDK